MSAIRQNVYDQKAKEYDHWFGEHPVWFQTEVNALAKAVPEKGIGLSIGVGTGRYAKKFGITHGLDPSEEIFDIAKKRGIQPHIGKADEMPYDANTFDYAVMVTTLCFLDGVPKVLEETRRVLKPTGLLIIGLIDKESPLGQKYQEKKKDNPFYRDAHFHSVPETTDWLREAGFSTFEYGQTFITASEEEPEEPQPGYGQGGFVVINAMLNE